MAVSRKRKRRIIVGKREYLWWIAVDDDFCGKALRVVSPDGAFHVKIPYAPIDPKRNLVDITAGPNLYVPSGFFRCPLFKTTAVTPRTVRDLIEWVLDPTTVWLPVDYNGNEV